ncbi:ROK family protein [Aliiruegeria sabulilitoris]|uniref:ROK family protein n=1 Tax=Aliiruegeria sabulilitoris TaxID=1510458 RepID=UPI0008356A39|nr:ROK family protein [Aliiruegeria sabulilitoris]NDR55324.1 ROK family protein [Pseudoruegeria sp. M32A2M]
MLCGGIDLGGTKIEARCFGGPQADTLETNRIPTPQSSFEDLMDALLQQIAWLETQAPGLPVGIAVPGILDPVTGVNFASNIPATGHSVSHSLETALGRKVPVVNDCMAFAFSEADGGAGTEFHSVMGLVLGTGVGGGFCLGSELAHRHAGLAVEIGHVGMSARVLARHGLPLWNCGCGRVACTENYISGTGLARLAEWKLGKVVPANEIAGHSRAEEILEIWADLAAECLDTIQLLLDPDCIVIGGGVSNMPGISERLAAALEVLHLGNARIPAIRTARHGDSSGARGAALLARKAAAS